VLKVHLGVATDELYSDSQGLYREVFEVSLSNPLEDLRYAKTINIVEFWKPALYAQAFETSRLPVGGTRAVRRAGRKAFPARLWIY
jgi:hypothetical protein